MFLVPPLFSSWVGEDQHVPSCLVPRHCAIKIVIKKNLNVSFLRLLRYMYPMHSMIQLKFGSLEKVILACNVILQPGACGLLYQKKITLDECFYTPNNPSFDVNSFKDI